jgi:phosphatidylinositol alpha-mannosyltransferase
VQAARSPVVATFHVHREGGHRLYRWSRPLLAPLMARIARRIAVSESARETVAAHFPGRYDVVPNGVDVDALREARRRPAAIGEGRHHIVYVGRLEPRKGVEHLVAAMARLRERRPEARLIVVGDGPARPLLESAARDRRLDAVFVGRVGDDALPGYFQSADIVCSPALGGESFGIVLLEALACEKPIVATRIDGYAALVPPGESAALAAALDQLLCDDVERRRCGARGLEVARRYDWAVIARRLEAIYEEARDSRSDRVRPGTTTY